MGDSDDEYHRRGGRDKFARERNDYPDRTRRDYDYDRRGGGGSGGGGGSNAYQRGDYANGSSMKRSSSRRDDYISSTKRSRIEASLEGLVFHALGPVFPLFDETFAIVKILVDTDNDDVQKFLATQDDSITDEEAIAKYSEYKLEFKRQELHKFFLAHKDEEWWVMAQMPSIGKRCGNLADQRRCMPRQPSSVKRHLRHSVTHFSSRKTINNTNIISTETFRLKYHPEDSGRRKTEQRENVLRRLEIFQNLHDEGFIDKLQIDYDFAPEIIRIMDTLVIKLEGGTEDDVAALKSEKIDDDETKKKLLKSMGKRTNRNRKKLERIQMMMVLLAILMMREKSNAKMEELGRQKKKMLLHKTSSIFLRNVAPNITMEEIEAACKRFPGFLRVGLADPVPDRKFYRRGWVTFRRDVNIKEICWNLNSVRIKECDLGAVINRDIARRVRSVNGITGHKQVAQNDLRQAAKLTALYDKKNGLYQSGNQEEHQSSFELDAVAQSQNPLLKNLTDFLIEEASAEEEELLGISSGIIFIWNIEMNAVEAYRKKGIVEEDQKVPFQRDDALIARLDRIIIYLRIVHSIDFYNHGEYPNEDVMPNRCGMMHVRGAPPSVSQWGTDDNGRTLIAQKFVTDFIAGFNSRIETALMSETSLTESELDSLGPEFIRKHLTTKHGEKLDQVRQEVLYFNNYLTDSKRPQNLEVKPVQTSQQAAPPREERRERERDYDGDRARTSGGGGTSSSYSDRDRRGGYERNTGGSNSGGRYTASYGGRSYDRGGTSRYWESSGSGRRDPREPITYKDLDAPEDIF
ncbi:Serrate RNA effector molecule-like protein [Dirofilaria immitis]|nr:Serrate RNA effector molecule-like protein [Dirofilaria immitis]